MDALNKLRKAYDILILPWHCYCKLVDIVLRPVVNAVLDYGLYPVLDAWMDWYERRHPSPDNSLWWEKRRNINALSVAEAKEVFIQLLAKGDVYSVVEEESNDPALDLLPPEVWSLLTRYRTIETDQCRLTRDAMSYDPVVLGTIWIGEECEDAVIIKLNEEPIYMDGPYLDERPLDEPIHQSVYHWLLCALPEKSMPDVGGV
jgi:hypothetical protein